jgi:aminocarboxymuconate-semialdehyde decarboxylase
LHCIDAHNHYFPKFYVDLFERNKDRFWVKDSYRPIDERSYDLESRTKEMDKVGIDKAVLSLGPPGVDRTDSIQESISLAKAVNDEIAKSCKDHENKFVGVATLPLLDVSAAVEELDRAVDSLSLKGAMIFSNVGGKYLDSEDLFPLYERAEQLGVPLHIHPTLPFGLESMISYGLYVTAGYLFDCSLSVLRMIHGGVLDKFPSLKLIISQLGGTLPYMVGRIDVQWKMLALKEGSKAKNPPSSYLRKMYLDSVSNYAPAYECASKLVSYDKILFGSDFPFGDMERSKKAIESLALSDEEKAKVLSTNTMGLFGIKS